MSAAAVMQIFPPLDAATEAALRASIERFGVLIPVTKDQNGRILDGHHRARIAKELRVDYGVRVRKVASEEEAREIARTLNEDRRHMPRAQRLPVVIALRADGHSQRAIAGALGVSAKTINKDLLGVTPVTPDAKVTGLDGKSYPAKAKQNGHAALPIRLDTGRGQHVAGAAKTRVERAVGNCSAIARGVGELHVGLAVAVAKPEEVKGWDEAFRDAISALKKLRARLKEAQS